MDGLFDHDLRPGRILGSYELIVPVGAGGMAHVWAARHIQSGAVFALKMLMPHLAENDAFRQMFNDEARIASRIRHDNVAQTFELASLDSILTLVMEWVDGSSLVRVLRPGSEGQDDARSVALPIRHAVKIVSETCAGLHEAHELRGVDGTSLGVVHRDVSPHNVLITRDGQVKVTDFGVAKALGQTHSTITGQIKGKLAYMSPEQLVGGGVDRRSDVFALGSVLYEATTGQRPFKGDHDPQVMSAIIVGNYERPSSVVRGYPRELEAIVARAMSTATNARFATALDLKRALDAWLLASGPPIGRAQIALLLQERCAPELDRRLSVLPADGSDPAPASTAPHVTAALGPQVDTARRGPRPADEVSLAAALGAVCVGLVLGLAVLAYVHGVRQERRSALPRNAMANGSNAHAFVAPVPTTPSELPAATIDIGEVAPPTDVVLDGARPTKHKAKSRSAPPVQSSAVVMPPNPYE